MSVSKGKMKILFINQIDISGGAAIAAWRIAESLAKYRNTENYFITASNMSGSGFVYDCTPDNRFARIADEYLIKISSAAGLQYIYIPVHRRKILEKVRKIRPDVINLHNIHGSYFQTGLIKELSNYAPVAWTLHDMWAFTRNASYTYGNNSWMNLKSFPGEKDLYPSMGFDTGDFLLRRKKRIYSNSRLSVIAPSKWLYGCAVNAPVFEKSDVVNIPYAIDTDFFSPVSKQEARKAIGLDSDMKCFFFNADWIKREPRKGGDLIPEILLKLNNNLKKKVSVITAGRDKPDNYENLKNLSFNFIGNVYGDAKIREVLRASDMIIHPSLADNLPNLLIEAGACGTPAAAFDVGGTSDIVINGENGILEKPFDVERYSSRLASLLEHEEILNSYALNARSHICNSFSSEKTAESYHNYFQKIIREKK